MVHIGCPCFWKLQSLIGPDLPDPSTVAYVISTNGGGLFVGVLIIQVLLLGVYHGARLLFETLRQAC